MTRKRTLRAKDIERLENTSFVSALAGQPAGPGGTGLDGDTPSCASCSCEGACSCGCSHVCCILTIVNCSDICHVTHGAELQR